MYMTLVEVACAKSEAKYTSVPPYKVANISFVEYIIRKVFIESIDHGSRLKHSVFMPHIDLDLSVRPARSYQPSETPLARVLWPSFPSILLEIRYSSSP